MFGWIRKIREADSIAKENEQLREKIGQQDQEFARMLFLLRALRDVNADLDRRLLESSK